MLALLLTALLTAPVDPLVLDDVTWRLERDGDRAGTSRLQLGRGTAAWSGIVLDQRLADWRIVRAATRADGPVSFTWPSEAGTLTCNGTMRAGRGDGRCRFVSSPALEAGLAARAIPLKRRDQLFELAITGARLGRVDDLARAGFPVRNADDLIGASALDVTGDYARELKSAGLAIRSFNDLAACRALKIDAAWMRRFAAAGFRLDARRAVTMKATGVTPDYARAIRDGGAK